MKTRSSNRSKKVLALAFSFGLVAAACGSDDEGGESSDPPSTEAEAPAEEAPAEEAPAEEAPAEEAPAEEAPAEEAPAEEAPAEEAPAEEAPSGEATGEPIKIGVQNLEGDPNGSFPEYSLGVQAAADYINAELGGLGGRPIEIELCKSIVSPDDSQRCANELSAAGVEVAISTINFFGNNFSIYQGSNIPVIVGTPITLADFTSEGVYSIGAGGGCLGVHTGLVQIATGEIEELEGITVNKVGVPWADTPPGVVCYNDLEAKPLDVIAGTVPGDSARAGEKPDLTYIGVPIAPATPDVTPQATEVLGFEPDVIIFSAQGADCWNFVDALGRLGWTPDQIPLILSGACLDFDAMAAAGDLAKGIYLTSTENGILTPPEGLTGQHLENATTYQTKAPEYGMPADLVFTGFGGQGFSVMMNIWEAANRIDGEVTGQGISDSFAATDGSVPAFGGSPLDCSGAPAPYTAVCSAPISLVQWDGTQLVQIIDRLSAIDLVAGTELRPG
jgi:branched-chain amino acid transport system substrate-binding protein